MQLNPLERPDISFRKAAHDALSAAARSMLEKQEIGEAQRIYFGTLFRGIAQNILSVQEQPPAVSALTLTNNTLCETADIPDELLVVQANTAGPDMLLFRAKTVFTPNEETYLPIKVAETHAEDFPSDGFVFSHEAISMDEAQQERFFGWINDIVRPYLNPKPAFLALAAGNSSG